MSATLKFFRDLTVPESKTNLRAQLRWAGHIAGMEYKKLPKQLLYGELREDRRRAGGLKKTRTFEGNCESLLH